MRPYRNSKWLPSGSQKEIVVITCYVTLPIAMGCKENKTYHGGKKGGVAKIYRGKSNIK